VELGESADHAAVDKVIESRKGSVVRRDVNDEAEIAAAERVKCEATKEARKRLWEERRTHQRSDVEAKISELKTKRPARRHSETSTEKDHAVAQVAGSV
jgi:hypothetical protein